MEYVVDFINNFIPVSFPEQMHPQQNIIPPLSKEICPKSINTIITTSINKKQNLFQIPQTVNPVKSVLRDGPV